MISNIDINGGEQPTNPGNRAQQPGKGDGVFRMPLNVERITQKVPEPCQQDVIWFHQHALDSALSWNDMAKALSYDRSTISRVIMCVYTGSWENVADRIRSYRKIALERRTIQRAEFRENAVSKKIFAALNFALINNDITLITGPSGIGKTATSEVWRERNNHGRSILVEVPPIGGPRALLRVIARAVGVSSTTGSVDMLDGVCRAFNPNRILILDEVLRLLPSSPGANPIALETVRHIHDVSGCALAFLATQRFTQSLRKLAYQFEQVIGRIGLPCPLTPTITEAMIAPLLVQYIPKPSENLVSQMVEFANAPGHIRNVVKTLQLASRIANKKGSKISEHAITEAIAIRRLQPEKKEESK